MDWGFVKVLLFKNKKTTSNFPYLAFTAVPQGVGTGPLSQKQCCKLRVGFGGENPLWKFSGRRPPGGLNSVQEAACWVRWGLGGCRRFRPQGPRGPGQPHPHFPGHCWTLGGTFLSPQWG